MNGRQIAWVIAIVTAFALLLYFLYRLASGNILWYEFYRPDEKQPYDLSVSVALLENYFPKEKFAIIKKQLDESLPYDTTGKSCYFFIGHSSYLSNNDQLKLFEFVRQGNQAFIAANEFPYGLIENFLDVVMYDEEQLRSDTDSIVSMNFTNPQLKNNSGYSFDFNFFWQKEIYDWNYFSDSLLNDSSSTAIRLGLIDEQYTNFIKIPYGKGAFYFHSNPIVFTNYHLKEEQRLQYAEKVFSHLEPANIYWDEYSKIPKSSSSFGGGDIGDNETPLRYILSQPSLKYAWYVLLAIAGLFLIFRTKRTQRMIPVLEQNTNTSLEYIQTISRLYFAQNNHRALALQQMKLFQAFIRNRYALHTKFDDDDFIKKLSVKSQINQSKIRKIAAEYKTISNMQTIEVHQLEEFHLLLEEFYRNCK